MFFVVFVPVLSWRFLGSPAYFGRISDDTCFQQIRNERCHEVIMMAGWVLPRVVRKTLRLWLVRVMLQGCTSPCVMRPRCPNCCVPIWQIQDEAFWSFQDQRKQVELQRYCTNWFDIRHANEIAWSIELLLQLLWLKLYFPIPSLRWVRRGEVKPK